MSPFDQEHVEFLLELLQRSVHGGVGDVQCLRGLHEIVAAGNLDESTQVAQADG